MIVYKRFKCTTCRPYPCFCEMPEGCWPVGCVGIADDKEVEWDEVRPQNKGSRQAQTNNTRSRKRAKPRIRRA